MNAWEVDAINGLRLVASADPTNYDVSDENLDIEGSFQYKRTTLQVMFSPTKIK
jgi:hypothetical protein